MLKNVMQQGCSYLRGQQRILVRHSTAKRRSASAKPFWQRNGSPLMTSSTFPQGRIKQPRISYELLVG